MNISLGRLSLGFVLALILTIIPMPYFLSMIRPTWVLLLTLFVQCFLPKYFRVFWVFLLGLYMDVMCSSIMGEHAFALLIATWFSEGRMRRLSYYSILHQMAAAALVSLLYQLVLYIINSFLGHPVYFWQVVAIPLISVLFWPWLHVLLPINRSQESQSKLSKWSYYDI